MSGNASPRQESYVDNDDDSSSVYSDQTVYVRPRPLTSFGTYLDGHPNGCEDLEEYHRGGYHPVHLGQKLGNDNRYRVIHRLGHGGFATVWLCRDVHAAKYVAIKVMTADIDPQGLIDFAIPESQYIAAPKDCFTVQGPNGTHYCLVLPLLGPQVFQIWPQLNAVGSSLRKISRQVVEAMKFLHQNGICHGDFRPSNILVKLQAIDDLPEKDLLSILGEPTQVAVRTENSIPLPKSSPEYLVRAADLSLLDSKYLTDDVALIDFGEAYCINNAPYCTGIPKNYLPPEHLVVVDDYEKNVPVDGVASELWALGCTLFEIRYQTPLLYMKHGKHMVFAEAIRLLAKPHDELWNSWDVREAFYDDDDGCSLDSPFIGEAKGPEGVLRTVTVAPIEVTYTQANGQDVTKSVEVSTEENNLIIDLLVKILHYEPKKRASVEEILGHAWFKYSGEDPVTVDDLTESMREL